MGAENANLAGGEPMLPRPWRVTRRRRETADTLTFELAQAVAEPAGELAPAAFRPGQFNMLYLFRLGEVPISIAGDPAAPETLVHTVRVVGSVTGGFAGLKPGGVIGVRGPYGTGWPIDAAQGRDVLVIAGGLGLAPLRPVIHHLLAERARFGRVAILYGARSPQDMLYAKELGRWRRRFDIEVGVTVDHAGADWRGRVGVITPLVDACAFDPANALAMICGPGIMMRVVVARLAERGLADSGIYVSLERNMKCAIGHCGHCQFGPHFLCKDGPVFRYDRIRALFPIAEI